MTWKRLLARTLGVILILCCAAVVIVVLRPLDVLAMLLSALCIVTVIFLIAGGVLWIWDNW